MSNRERSPAPSVGPDPAPLLALLDCPAHALVVPERSTPLALPTPMPRDSVPPPYPFIAAQEAWQSCMWSRQSGYGVYHPLARNAAGGLLMLRKPRRFSAEAERFWVEVHRAADVVVSQYRSRLRLRMGGGAPCVWVHEGQPVSQLYPTRGGAMRGLATLCGYRRAALVIALCDPRQAQLREDVGIARTLPWDRNPLNVFAPDTHVMETDNA